MPLFYDIGLGLYHAGIRIAAPFVPKAKAWVEGRRGTWQRLEAKRDALRGCLWMHCASVGEFEQGRPVLEALKKERPELPVLITFYSPSGYEARKDFPMATHVEYLPADGAANAKRFLDLVQPKAVLWVKYEFWFHFLHALKERSVPTFLVSAIFRKDQPFFRWFGDAHRGMLKCFTRLFVQDEASRDLLASIALSDVEVSGDTRFDRVTGIVNAFRNDELVGEEADMDRRMFIFRNGWPKPIVIFGSTWEADVQLLATVQRTSTFAFRSVIVPHELSEEGLALAQRQLKRPSCRWSRTDMEQYSSEQDGDLIVDRMGWLARLYQYGDVAYVGGGFGDGIHSLLEAAAWGKPVIFGPNHKKFAEAKGLIEAGGGFEVNNAGELRAVLVRLLGDPVALATASEAAARYVRERVGATKRIVGEISARIA